jgi:hypothetical protein
MRRPMMAERKLAMLTAANVIQLPSSQARPRRLKTRRGAFLSPEETLAVLRKAKERGTRDLAMILLAYRHGPRASEVCGLSLADVDLKNGALSIQRLKGSMKAVQPLYAHRGQPLLDEVITLRAWLRVRPVDGSDYLFTSQKGGRLDRTRFFRVFQAVAIGVFDRSAALPTGGSLEQADGTPWVSMFSQNMLEIAIELTAHDPMYEDMALKFAEHFIWIARAMNQTGPEGMWDEEDGFYYDVLRLPDGSARRLKVRSMVGLLPLCATTVIEPWQRERCPRVLNILRELTSVCPNCARACMRPGQVILGMASAAWLRW